MNARRLRRVGENAAYARGREQHHVDLVLLEEAVHGRLIRQVELRSRARDDVVVTLGVQPPDQRGADHATVARDEDACVFVHRRLLVMFQCRETGQRDERVTSCDLIVRAHHFLDERRERRSRLPAELAHALSTDRPAASRLRSGRK